MCNKNTKAIVDLAKNKTISKEEFVLKEIYKIQKKGGKITIYSIAKTTGVSRSFLYNNPKIFETINNYRHTKEKRKVETTQTIIKNLQLKIEVLEKEKKELLNNANYKIKYEKLLSENNDLKKQLEMAYTY